ncbi:hypothetical protein CANCADRAFT_3856 [Tortispora caseinolytica NRRL Y-17796]|uniref:Pre-mRNA-splicing factor SLU7 n=1 Tax=Tortispora caseinolytica NRRL Y-17796 TaxID=767744 RepID=A0A1E4TBU7_9ASCO|nr:hypothetical protein CANCADRAFT_3856 [Tortispora caseinolytica NRRL Y-17796]
MPEDHGRRKADRDLDNPNLPQYVAKTPWYLGEAPVSTEVAEVERSDLGATLKRRLVEDAPKKFKKGACENCGATNHKTMDCLERPRKVSAKYSKRFGKNEEIKTNLASYDAKRDRWNDYDANDYEKVLKEYKPDEKNNVQKEPEVLKPGTYARTLRERHDIAGYLRKDTVGRYDPKTRTLKEEVAIGQRDLNADFERADDLEAEVVKKRLAWKTTKSATYSMSAVAAPTEQALLRKREKETEQQTGKYLEERYG